MSGIGLVALALATGARASAPVADLPASSVLTLSAAVDTALSRSPAILEAVARRDAASATRREVRALRLPHVQIREIAVHTDAPADVFGLTLMQERFSLPEFTTSDPNHPDPVDNFATEFEATWPVYMGGRVMAGLDQAGQMEKAAEAAHGHTRSAVALATASAYMDAVLAERSAELAQRARDTTARHVDQAQAFFDAGMMVESDLLQARVQLARMDEKLIAAKNAIHLTRAHLFQTIGIEQDAGYTLDGEIMTHDVPVASLEDALASARERRDDLRAAQAQVSAANSGIRRARGEYLPELALIGRYSLNDDQMFGNNGESYSLMAIARWNVIDWGQTRARVSGARAQYAAAEQARRSQIQTAEFEVRQAWLQATEARARFDVAAGAVTQAERALAIVEDRFEQGVVRIADLLDAETSLDDARVRELNARFDAQRATRSLAFAAGLPPVPEVTP